MSKTSCLQVFISRTTHFHSTKRGDDPWKDITLIGEEKIIKQIKFRSGIANRLTSLGTTVVTINSPTKEELVMQLTCNEDSEAIRHAYALIKDLQLFLDVSFY